MKNGVEKILKSNWSTIVLISVLSIYFLGYRTGADNLNILIPVRQIKDPLFLANDLVFSGTSEIGRFLLLRTIYYLSRFFSADNLLFILHLISRTLLCAGIYKLAYTLTKDKSVAFFSIIAVFYLFSERIPLGSSHLVSSQFYASYFSRAIAFFAIAFFIEQKYIAAFLLLGLGTNIHFLTGTQTSGILFVCLMIHWRKIGLKTLLHCVIVYVIVASPELINALNVPLKNAYEGGIGAKEYIEIVGYIRTPHHFIPSTWSIEQYLRYAIFVIAGTYSYFHLRKSDEMRSGLKLCIITAGIILLFTPFIYYSTSIMLYHSYRMSAWLYAIMLIFIVDCLLTSFNGKSMLLKIWAVLSLAFLNSPYILSWLFSIRILNDLIQEKTKGKTIFLFLSLAASITIFFIPVHYNFYNVPSFKSMLEHPVQSMGNYLFFSIIFVGFVKIILRPDLQISKKINFILLPLTLFLVLMTLMNQFDTGFNRLSSRFQPKLKLVSENAEFMDVSSWIKENTDKQATIIVPPHMKGFRYHAERAILANFKFYPLSTNKVKEWYERLDLLSKKDLSKNREKILNRKYYKDNPRPSKILKKGYKKLNGNDFYEIGRKYNCSYVITASDHEVALKKVYQNAKYNVYKL